MATALSWPLASSNEFINFSFDKQHNKYCCKLCAYSLTFLLWEKKPITRNHSISTCFSFAINGHQRKLINNEIGKMFVKDFFIRTQEMGLVSNVMFEFRNFLDVCHWFIRYTVLINLALTCWVIAVSYLGKVMYQ